MEKTSSLLTTVVFAVTLFVGFAGCAGSRNNIQPALQQMQAKEEMVPHPVSKPSVSDDGSLWQVHNSLNVMFMDTKSRNVGDIVTVEINESAKASNKANTETGRTSSLEAGIEKLFGIEDWWQNQMLPKINNDFPRIDPFGNPSVKGSMKSKFAGDGATTRSGTLSAFITCRVVDVMPNGNLKIVGTREVMVNNENQLIILSGIIRPRDISEENVIMSTFISDAKIAYSGSGIVDDRQRPGWLANLLNNVWPF
ncbi:MAG: flagellar basal body L-ring protein FlgH [Deltaproteobacteria bacterium]|jgi:flagellar L-ring protein precursor FlgH|nr:flagellar basal body L-ring protein FlgH [Deltaproteobacteria bacterium]MBW2450296.1 flagellar basal body L-ring protein FlgH [Deltaproteobacteria bacterium]